MLLHYLVEKLKMDICCASFVLLIINFDRMVSSPTEKSIQSSSNNEIHGETFSMNRKQLKEVPEGNISVSVLDLAYNNLSFLPINAFQNKSFEEITILDLHENKINNVSFSAFRGLRRLTVVDLSFNQIKAINPFTFEYNGMINKLDLTRNNIKFRKSEVFLVSPSMQTLILRNNDIDQLYELTFVGLRHLTSLMLDDNCLTKIHSNSLKPLIDLQFLSMTETRVMHLKTSMFIHVPRVIDIESTPLAKKFDPPLTRIKKEQVTTLLEAESS